MKLGIIIGDTRTSVTPREHLGQLLRQVEAAQRNGFTYITIGQHFVYGGLRWLQPIPTLARLAAEVDAHVRLATNIIVVPLYHPIHLAEELATLDIVSEGRLVIGAGMGYRPDEFTHFQVPREERVSRFEECLGLVRRLWTEERVDHDGTHWRLSGVEPHLRPWQQPHPEIWIGAQTPAGVRRAARLGDRWTISPRESLETLAPLYRAYSEARADRGERPMGAVMRRDLMVGRDRADAIERFAAMAQGRYVTYAQKGLHSLDEDKVTSDFADSIKETVLLGTPDDIAGDLQRINAEVPLEALVVRPQWPDMSADDVVAYLDELGRDIVPLVADLAQPVEAG